MNALSMKRSLSFIVLLSISLCICGCGRAKRAASTAADTTKTVATKAGKVVGEHVGNFFAGVGEGVENSVCDYAVRIDAPELSDAGVSVSLVRRVSDDPKAPALSLYILNERPVSGTLRVRFLTEDGREIGRGEAAFDRAADGAGYIRIPLPADMPSEIVRTVALSLVAPDNSPNP